MRTSRAALKPRCCIASRTAAPCGSSTVAFGVTITFTFIRHYYPASARLEVERQVFLPGPFRNRRAFPKHWFHGRIQLAELTKICRERCRRFKRIISSFSYKIYYLLHSNVPGTNVRAAAAGLARYSCRAGGRRSYDERAEPASKGDLSGRSSSRQIRLQPLSSDAE